MNEKQNFNIFHSEIGNSFLEKYELFNVWIFIMHTTKKKSGTLFPFQGKILDQGYVTCHTSVSKMFTTYSLISFHIYSTWAF